MEKIVLFLVLFIKSILEATKPVSDKIISIFYNFFGRKRKLLPPIDNNLLLLSATSLAKKIRTQQVKCEDVMHAYVTRAKAVQPLINAITDARYEKALEDARNVDKFLSRKEKSLEQIEKDTPLLGVPFSCKEVMGIKGLLQTAGLYKDRGRRAKEDGDAPALYVKAGAIPVTVTNVPELCMTWETANTVYGSTQNPYDNRKTPGGSSGGEGSLITSAGALIGIGTDLGGSIRIPSAFNGIYGHKPSTGVISNRGYYPWIEPEKMKFNGMNTTGPMCRYAEDLSLLLKVLSQNDSRLQLKSKVDFKRIKLYYMEEFPGIPVMKEIKTAILKAVKHFEEQYGIKAQSLTIEELKSGFEFFSCKYQETNQPPIKVDMADKNGEINIKWELIKWLFGMSKHTFHILFFSLLERKEKDKRYYECLKQFDVVERKFQDIFKEDALLLVPTHAETPPFRHLIVLKFANAFYTTIFNLLGLPATNIPAGLHNGMPFGIQAVSGLYNDRLTIAAALELDKVFGGWKSPCSIAVK